MPFFKQPPENVIDAYIAELKKSGISQNRITVEEDLDRITWALHHQLMVDEAAKKLPPELAKLLSKSPVEPIGHLIVAICNKHFSNYYK